MIRHHRHRLTALVLVAILLTAAAAPLAAQPAVGTSPWAFVLAWLDALWRSDEPDPAAAVHGLMDPGGTPTANTGGDGGLDFHGLMDPNG